MLFSIEEIKNYLAKHQTMQSAIGQLTEENIVVCNPIETKSKLQKTESNLEKYEVQIGMSQLKEHHLQLRRNSSGKEGKKWMACNLKWIEEKGLKDRLETEYDAAYWVNYGDDNTFGWFSIEQIKLWLSTPELELHTLGGTKKR
jgi:hypothetical protein